MSDSPPDRDGGPRFDGSDRGWVWFLVLAVPVAAFLISYALDMRDQFERAANPPGVRIGLVSQLYGTDTLIALVFGGLTMLVLLYFAVRFRSGSVDVARPLEPRWGANTFRLLIIAVAVIMVVTFMYAGTALSNTDQMSAQTAMQRYGAKDKLDVSVVGSQWVWRTHVQGVNVTQTDEVHVPANTLLAVTITSADVDHSWAVEQLGVKKDAIPGEVTHTWLYVKKPGKYQINCAELCGAGHSKMTATLDVMSKQKYVQWAHSHGYSVPFADGGSQTQADLAAPSHVDATAPTAAAVTGVSGDV
ncbi:MAG: cytochrome c oxidase subunit II [Haloarculaceae archaeon]